MNWYSMLEKMIRAGRYPNYEAMKNKISNAVLEDLIAVEQGEELLDLLSEKEGIE